MKRLLGLLGILLCGAVWGQVSPGFVSGQILTAAQLNATFAQAVAVTNGSVSNLTVTAGLTATGLITTTDLASQAANTLLANVTGTAASPSAVALPTGCNTSTSALQYTTGTFTCGTVAMAGTNSNITSLTGLTTPLGTWAGGLGVNNSTASGVPVFVSGTATVTATTGTGAPVLGTSPTLTTPVISGVVGGACATAGNIGECLQASASAVALTNSTPLTCTSLTLTAGDWLVEGNIAYNPTTTAFTLLDAGFNTTTNTLPSGANLAQLAFAGTSNFGQALIPPARLFLVTSSTPVYLVGEAGFSGGSATMTCSMFAVRFH